MNRVRSLFRWLSQGFADLSDGFASSSEGAASIDLYPEPRPRRDWTRAFPTHFGQLRKCVACGGPHAAFESVCGRCAPPEIGR